MDFLFLLYMVCFGVGLLFAVISAFAADIFGGGHEAHVEMPHAEGHAEAGLGTQDMPGFSPLSPTTIASFVTAFGGLGMLFSKFESTRSPWVSGPLAAIGGVVIAGAVFWLFQQIFSHTQSSSEGKVVDLIGQTAIIITPIPEKGVGEIAYVQGGSRYSAPAREEGGQPIANGQRVVITRIAGTQFYVSSYGQ